MGGMGIFEFPAMVSPDGSLDNLWVAFAGVILTMVIAFIVMFVTFKDKKEENPESNSQTSTLLQDADILSPLSGTIISLEKVEDGAFSSGALGNGVGIIP